MWHGVTRGTHAILVRTTFITIVFLRLLEGIRPGTRLGYVLHAIVFLELT